MGRPTRLATKTIWSLEDIIARCGSARGRWGKAMLQAERNQDPAMMLVLAYLRDDIAEIERLAKDARHGDYQQE